MKRILSMANFRRKMGYPSFKELSRLEELGHIKIQHSGFKSDSHHHHKIVCIKDLDKIKEILLNERPLQPVDFDEETAPTFIDTKNENKVLIWIRPDIRKELVATAKRPTLNIYVRDIPTGLYLRLKRLKQLLGCTSWIHFLHETDKILDIYLKKRS